MIKGRGCPIIGRVTISAFIAKLTLVSVIFGVAGGTVHGCAFEDSIFVATLTGNGGMFAVQMERKL